MNGHNDQQLLREFVECRSEQAFAELVRRHVDLVYSAAMRMVRDTHLAEDVSQAVFATLAQNAPRLAEHPALCGWLHRTARNVACKIVRSDVVRRAREQEAAAMNQLLSAEPDAPWEQIAPHLDAALDHLCERDRIALMLRYFQSKSAREIAQTLGVSEEAAQKRVNRAVERLRGSLAKQGVAAGVGGLAAVISANAVQAAPVGLAGVISTSVLANGLLSATTTLAAAKALAMTTTQKAALLAAAALGTGLYQARQISVLRHENLALTTQHPALLSQLSERQRELSGAREQFAAAERENQRLKSTEPVAEVLKGRGEVARWRSVATDSDAAAIRTSLDKVESLKLRLEQTPSARIPELALLTEKDWFDMAKSDLKSDEAYRWAFAGLRHAAQHTFAPLLQGAMRGYLYANQGRPPTNLLDIVPFFKPPLDATLLEGWQIAPREPNEMGGDFVVTQKTAVDKDAESRVFLTPYGNSWESWNDSSATKKSP